MRIYSVAMKVARPLYAGPNREPAAPETVSELEQTVKGEFSVPQKAYLWALNNPNLSGVIANMVNSQQVDQNLGLPLVRFSG